MLLIGLTLLALPGCRPKNAAPAAPPPPVAVDTVTVRDWFSRHEIVAAVRPLQSVKLRARVSGFLRERNFVEGSAVKAGQLLYRIEPDDYRIAVRQAEAELERCRAEALNALQEYTRAAALFEAKIAPPKRYDTAVSRKKSTESAVLAAQAALDRAKLDLSYTEITAPFDGWIGLTQCDVGNYVAAPSAELAELVRIDRVRVRFALSDGFLSEPLRAEIGAGRIPDWPVQFRNSDGTLAPETGRIRFAANAISDTTATLALEGEFNNEKRTLLPGTIGTVLFADPLPRRAPGIDRRALRSEQGANYVFVLNRQNQLEFRRVEAGAVEGDRVEIRSGLAAGERVALAGNPWLRPGETVRPLAEAQTPRPQ